jgi:hypothetical protein
MITKRQKNGRQIYLELMGKWPNDQKKCEVNKKITGVNSPEQM